MAEKMGYLERMADQHHREHVAAAKSEYKRCVSSGVLNDTPEAYIAFGLGWSGVRKFRAATRAGAQVGANWHMLGVLFLTFGGILVGMSILAQTQPLVFTSVWWLAVVGLCGMLLALPAFKARNKQVGAWAAAHRKVWGDPDEETSLYEEEDLVMAKQEIFSS